MEIAVLLLSISTFLLSLRACIEDFRRMKNKKNWFKKSSEPVEKNMLIDGSVISRQGNHD